jgi:RNA polymerase sigma factor (sigma-70 family)
MARLSARPPNLLEAPLVTADANQVHLGLIRRAAARDPRAYRALVDELTPTIQKRVLYVLLRFRGRAGNRDMKQELADLTQEVFLKLFADGSRALLQWDPERGSALHTFVGLVAEREAISRLRVRRNYAWDEEPFPADEMDVEDVSEGPEGETASRQMLEGIWARLPERLDERGLLLFHLLLIDERSTEDVCAITSMTSGAVHTWRSRLRKVAQELAREISSEKGTASRTSSKGERDEGG